MNIAMVDDNQANLDKINAALQEYAAANKVEIEFHPFLNCEKLLEDYQPFLYSVIFLDIYLGGMTGIEAAEKIRAADKMTLLVFLTESDERQADAIHWNAYDYILKSDLPGALWMVLDHIFSIESQREEERFSFSSNHKHISVSYDELVFVQADKNYLIVRDKGGAEHRIRMTFSSVAGKLLQDERFLEITRGTIVNMKYVSAFTETLCVLKDSTRLPVNLRNAKRLSQIFRNYLFLDARNQS